MERHRNHAITADGFVRSRCVRNARADVEHLDGVSAELCADLIAEFDLVCLDPGVVIQDEFYVVREGVVVVLDVDECRISAVLTGATDVHDILGTGHRSRE